MAKRNLLIYILALASHLVAQSINYNTGTFSLDQNVATCQSNHVSLPVNLNYVSRIKSGHDYLYASNVAYSTTGLIAKDKNVTALPLKLQTGYGEGEEKVFLKGFGMSATPTGSSVTINLNGEYSRLKSTIGVDASSVSVSMPVIFEVWSGTTLLQSKVIQNNFENYDFDIDIRNVQTLKLVAKINGTTGSNMANWCDTRVLRKKQSQQSSWAGLGFDLDLPYIERTIEGAPDNASGHTYEYPLESYYKGTCDLLRTHIVREAGSKLFFDFYNYKPLLTNYSETNDAVIRYPKMVKSENQTMCITSLHDAPEDGGTPYDEDPFLNNQSQQDNYSLVNFPKGGCQLYFSNKIENGKLKASVLPFKPWVVNYETESDNAEIKSWSITDEDGTKYTFGGTTVGGVDARVIADNPLNTGKKFENVKITYQVYSNGTKKNVYSVLDMPEYSRTVERWYLTKVESYDGDRIDVEYTPISNPPTKYQQPYFNDISKWESPIPPQIQLYMSINLTHGDSPGTFDGNGITCSFGSADNPEEPSGFMYLIIYGKPKGSYENPQILNIVKVDEIHEGSYMINRLITLPTPMAITSIVLRFYGRSMYNIYGSRAPCFWENEVSIGQNVDYAQRLDIQFTNTNQFDFVTFDRYGVPSYSYDVFGTGPYGRLMAGVANLGTEKENFLQANLTDQTKKYLQVIYPSKISSPFQEVRFETLPFSIDDEIMCRPILHALSTYYKNSTGTTQVSRTIFNSSIVDNRLFLDGLSLQKFNSPSTTKSMMSFKYSTETKNADKFGNIPWGQMKEIADINGGKTVLTYAPKKITYLTTNEKADPNDINENCGYSVVTMSKNGGFGTPIISTNATYSDGEMSYNSAVKSSTEKNWFYGGIQRTLDLFEYNTYWNGLYDFSMDRYDVSFRKVKTSSGYGSTTYNYINSSSDQFTKDQENKYHIGSFYRGMAELVIDSSSDNREVQRTQYKYTFRDFSGNSAYLFTKPQTMVQQFELGVPADYSGYDYCARIPEVQYLNIGQQGLPAATTKRTINVQLKETITTIDGVTQLKTFTYNNEGLPRSATTYKGASTANDAIATSTWYGYEIHNATGLSAESFKNLNLLTPAVRQTVNYKISTYPGNTVNNVSNVVWKKYNEANGTMYPWRTYSWVPKGKDQYGRPYPEYNGSFDWNLTNLSPEWILVGENIARSEEGWLYEAAGPLGILHTSTIYRSDYGIPIANITGASYKECAVWTPDFTGNGWGYGLRTTQNTLAKHFGTSSYKVNNDWGPSKNINITDFDKTYELSAWVYPVDVEVSKPITLVIEKRFNGSLQTLSEQYYPQHLLETGKWNHIKLEITPAQMADIKAATGDKFLRVHVSSNPTGTDVNDPFIIGQSSIFYVDEVRFAPKNALVSTSYFDDRNRVVCTVDANNSAKYVEYDDWDRVCKAYNNAHRLIMKKEYHLIGPNIPPTKPTNLTATVNYPAITFTWQGGDLDLAQNVNYRIEMVGFPGNQGGWTATTSALGSQTVLQLTTTPQTLLPGGCHWTVSATDERGETVSVNGSDFSYVP